MTLPVVDSWDLKGLEGPKYKVGPTCSNPSCKRWAEHAHHLVRRSQLKGVFDWVEIEGVVYPNLCGLCAECHDLITGRVGGHKAAIRLNAKERLFYWADIVESPQTNWITYLPFKPLDPHPPAPDSLASRASNEEEPEACPYCGQAKTRRRAATPPGGARRRKSWAIKVPDDAEDGAEILDTLVDDLAPHLHVEPSQTGRYYIVVPSLVYVHQNLGTFLDSLRGVGA